MIHHMQLSYNNLIILVHFCIISFIVACVKLMSLCSDNVWTVLLQNDIETLKSLTTKWQLVVQKAVIELHESISEPRPSLTEFVKHLQLDHSLIGFNVDDESFDWSADVFRFLSLSFYLLHQWWIQTWAIQVAPHWPNVGTGHGLKKQFASDTGTSISFKSLTFGPCFVQTWLAH